jgi:hypothetical protein
MKKQSKNNGNDKLKITPKELEEEIRKRAQEIFLERGDEPGDALSDWLKAEKEIKKKYKLS